MLLPDNINPKLSIYYNGAIMDVKKYFEEITDKINNMSDEEFMQILNEAGLDNCPSIHLDKGKGKS